MTKSVALIILLLIARLLIAQPNVPKRQAGFKLHNTCLVVSNTYIGNSSEKTIPSLFQLSSKPYVFDVWDKELLVTLFTDDLISATGYAPYSYLMIDSSARDRKLFNPKEIELRITKNANLLCNWTPVLSIPYRDSSMTAYVGIPGKHIPYRIFKDTLAVNDRLDISFRHTSGKVILQLLLRRTPTPVQPFLYATAHDSARVHGDVDFLEKQLTLNGVYDPDLFYAGWPGQGLQLNGTPYWPSSRLLLKFRSAYPEAKDNTLEYKLKGGAYSGNIWQVAQGKIFIPLLEAGENYELKVRYKNYPEHISVYRFSVSPYWYQTSLFRIGLLILVGMAMAIIFYRWKLYAEKRKNLARTLELKLLNAQLNPHFLFNALSSIQGLIRESKIEKAGDYLAGFSALLRAYVRTSNKEFIPLSDEIKNLENYIRLEALRFGFKYELNIVSPLQPASIETPPFLSQPFVENAVKHALAEKRENGHLTVTAWQDQEDILLSIADNGPGFDPSTISKDHGISFTMERIRLFNHSLEKRKIVADITSSESGTLVQLRFKNWVL